MTEQVKKTAASGSYREALVARQPIYESNQRTFGYELLFRNSSANVAVVDSPERATAQVIVNSFLEIGLDRLVGAAPGFINVTASFILADYCRSLPKERIIFEILEDTVPTRELMEALQQLNRAGYRFALDDYTFQPQLAPLLPFCAFVKVDYRQMTRQQLAGQMPGLHGKPFKLLAEKVETIEEFEFCRDIGFHYFQGYFFCRPKILSGSTISPNRIVLCRLLAKLHEPEISTREIESVVGEDLSLSYRLLRYINSASVALTKTVESINHAVRLVGTNQIRFLASLIMLTSLDEKPRELMATSLIRAKMSELLAARLGFHMTEPFFTVGLFSTLDAFLDCPMADALELLPLASNIRDALLTRSGDPGRVLDSVLSYEQAEWDSLRLPAIDDAAMREAYVSAVEWADRLIRSFDVKP